jgi:hypothetical protein
MITTFGYFTKLDQIFFARSQRVYICEILPKSENSKFRNEVILKVFNSQKVRGKNSKNHQISILGFECVAKDIEG